MRALTIFMYLSLLAAIVLILLTVTSNGRIAWDESLLGIVPLLILAVVLNVMRRRSAGRSVPENRSV